MFPPGQRLQGAAPATTTRLQSTTGNPVSMFAPATTTPAAPDVGMATVSSRLFSQGM